MAWPGEALLIRMWDTLAEKGVGGLLKPWQMKREARAQLEIRSQELVALADAEREAADIRSGKLQLEDSLYAFVLKKPVSPVGISADGGNFPPPIAHRIVAGIIGDNLREEINVAKAIAHAESELKDDPAPPPKDTIADDWLFRWRDYAGTVSSDELQSIWGRILAGELKAPGRFSYRTLDFVRNLTPSEAALVAALAPFVIGDFIARTEKNILEKNGLDFGRFLELQELGIVAGVESVGVRRQLASAYPDKFAQALCCHGRAIIVRHNDPKKVFWVSAYSVTRVGEQMMQLGKFAPNEEYLKCVGLSLKRDGAQVAIADYVPAGAGAVRLSNEIAL